MSNRLDPDQIWLIAVKHCLTSFMLGNFMIIFCKIIFKKKSFLKCHRNAIHSVSVDLGYELFAKIISRQQKVSLAGKELINSLSPMKFFVIFFKINFFEKFFLECRTDWIQIRPGFLSGLIWVQSVCKSYQQTTIGDKELNSATCTLAVLLIC